MAEQSKIHIAEATCNPFIGCTPCSPGCQNCYAQSMARRQAGIVRARQEAGNDVYAGKGQDRYSGVIGTDGKWNGETRFDKGELYQLLKWRNSRRVFIVSMGDLFHENNSFDDIDIVFSVMAICRQHTFMVLTKRPERMQQYYLDHTIKSDGIEDVEMCRRDVIAGEIINPSNPWRTQEDADVKHIIGYEMLLGNKHWPLPNVWVGVTVCNQEEASIKLPLLLEVPAVKRFVSIEPMLGPVDLSTVEMRIEDVSVSYNTLSSLRKVDWVICGGETGPGATPLHPDWVRSLRDQCYVHDTPFMFKQWGEWTPGENVEDTKKYPTVILWNDEWIPCSDDWVTEADDGPIMYNVGRRKAGRFIDGKVWDDVPDGRDGK